MATKVHMEALSPTMEEGQLVRWLKQEGDSVSEGDIIAEIETDKATMELVARGSGVLRRIALKEGGTAPVGQVIAVIAAEDEDISALVPDTGGPATAKTASTTAGRTGAAAAGGAGSAAPAAPRAEAPPAARAVAAAEGDLEEEMTGASLERARDVPGDNGGSGDGRVKASPLARRLASEAGIALDAVRGSGPGGRIVKRDIEAAAKTPATQPAAVAPAPALRRVEGPDYEDVPVSQMRKAIAKRLVTSIGPIPTFYLTIDVDMTRLLAARESVNARLERTGLKTSINDFIVKATAVALARHREVNAQWAETAIRRHARVHIGVAVAIDDGLITPVVRDANLKGIVEIAAEVRELAGRAREKRLKPEEYTGATFSISNLGMFGIEEFTAIINPPEPGILAIGSVAERVVVEHGEMVIRSRMRVTMSCDHRVIDGATGARFLQTLRDYLEEPAMMLT
ncbi:MAG: pyruvate dehydrogenase complex dihydrolipoamide acetyltransferase [Gemmatimonadetes bacterium]|nr:pyruvate dehydrogenase complex dihydrolipoamide acetyltransferase [Gemmatimonadota bacterium]